MAQIRIDKYLADVGHGTRSQVKNLIKQGRVKVNDTLVKKSDIKVNTEIDVVYLDGKELQYAEYQYYMLNKPQGVVSATTDKNDKTVVELIDEEKRRDLFPVGRLDKDTEGLLIITNDGPLANKLLAPAKHVSKKYYAHVKGEVTEDIIKKFEEGLDIGDEKLTKPAKLSLIEYEEEENLSRVEVVITEGRYHQIKRMFEAFDQKVIYLKRLSMGPICLDENLSCGSYRKLSDEEIKMLKGE